MDAGKKRELMNRIKNEFLQNARVNINCVIFAMDAEMWSLSDLRDVDEMHQSLTKMLDDLADIDKFFNKKLGNIK